MARKLFTLMIVAVGLSSAAMALPNDPWLPLNPGDELNVYEVYNLLFGPPFYTDSDDLPVVSPDDVFGENYAVTAEARYAGAIYTQFGWYPTSDSSDLNPLFTVNTTGLLGGAPSGNTAGAPSEYGFYINLQAPSGTMRTWYTQSGLNADLFDHAYLFATPDADTFLLAWEDNILNRSDLDYNDLIVVLHRYVVPEPTSMLLLGMGVAGMLAHRARRAFSRA